jgi:hypothetical protein
MRCLILLFLLSSLSSSAQVADQTKLYGSWTLIKFRDKPIDGFEMNLFIKESQIIISNGFQTIESSYALSNNKKYILCSNDDGDEEWKVLSLSSDKLILDDRSNKMEFIKTGVYNAEIDDELTLGIGDHNIIENEKLILGYWVLAEIDGKLTEKKLSLSFRPRGSVYYNFMEIETAASWSLSEDKKSINMVAYNGQSEIWKVKNYRTGFLQIATHGKIYTFVRN